MIIRCHPRRREGERKGRRRKKRNEVQYGGLKIAQDTLVYQLEGEREKVWAEDEAGRRE